MPAPAGSRARAWVFTVNNPDNRLSLEAFDPELKYGVYQLERGEQGTPHYQGYLEFINPVSMAQVKNNLPTAHLERRKGTAVQARDYAMKLETREDGPWEFGEFSAPAPGKRTDIQDMKDFILTGDPKTKNQIMDEFPSAYARCSKFVDELLVRRQAQDVETIKLDNPRPWQAEAIELLEDDPHPRTIFWIYDEEGNSGKSYFVRYYVTNFPEQVFFNNGGKTSDIAYAYNGQKFVFFDYAREKQDSVNYQVMEQLKNGMMFSSKYNSVSKVFPVPHVMVMANFKPDNTKFSRDRLRLFQIGINFTWDEIDF